MTLNKTNRGEQILSLTVITILGFGYSQIPSTRQPPLNGWNIADTAQNTILSNQSVNQQDKIMPIWDFSISLCLVGNIRRLHVLLSLHLVFPVVLGSKEENFLELFSLTLFADGLKKREAVVTERQCRFTERSFWSTCKYWYSSKEMHYRWFNNMFLKNQNSKYNLSFENNMKWIKNRFNSSIQNNPNFCTNLL